MPFLDPARIRRAFAHLVLPEEFFDKIGPAINSTRSLFLYGPPGNGKTAIAETISHMLGGEVFVPHAIEIDSQIIKVYDPLAHHEIFLDTFDRDPLAPRKGPELDQRWLLSRRPVVTAGGELTLQTLDLIWNDNSRFYEAPFQVKANGGMLLIDDFGRQRVHPTDLLNRWIVPLEKRVDYLTLHTGKKLEIPFDQLIVFSTNLDPRELVDEAFLRRIKYKIEVPNPTVAEFHDIFQRVCRAYGVPYSPNAVDYLLAQHYDPRGIELRGCHPRDIVQLLVDVARYRGAPPQLERTLLEHALKSFFVEI